MSASARVPLVTVAVATYNSADYVEAAVASALGQTLPAIEVIAVDDRSSDDTVERLERMAARDGRLSVERLPVNSGPAAARNVALRSARGRWFTMLDSDDLYAPDRLERMVATATEHGADIVADDLVTFTDGDPASAQFHLGGAYGNRWLGIEEYLAQTLIFGGGLDLGFLKPLIDLHRLRELGLSYDERLRIGEDDDLVVRALLAGLRYRIDPQPTYAYRKHAASISHRLSQANASAMLASATGLTRPKVDENTARLLDARASAMARALSFTRMIDALKAKRLGEFTGICLSAPAALALFRMPLDAAWRRATARFAQAAKIAQNPTAVTALQRILEPTDPRNALATGGRS